MAIKIVVEGSTVSASQLKDLLRQIEDGSITGRVLQAFLEHRNPFESITTGTFKHDLRKEGWTLLENMPRRISSVIKAVPFLRDGETEVSGQVMNNRAIEEFDFGQEDAEWLLEHQDMIPAKLQKFQLVFPGTKWDRKNWGFRVPCLRWHGTVWCLCFDSPFNDGWGNNDRFVAPCR